MNKETLILQELFIPILQKYECFEKSKYDSLFWNKLTSEFINFEQDKKPFYATIYSLKIVNVEHVLNELESLLNTFLDQLAEAHAKGYNSDTTQKLSKINVSFNERVLFYNNLKKAIFLSERKKLKSELTTMFEKYSFELDDNQLNQAITISERHALKSKMKGWDDELIKRNSSIDFVKFSLADDKSLIIDDFQRHEGYVKRTEHKKNNSFFWTKFAIFACFVLGLTYWENNYRNQTNDSLNPVLTKPKAQGISLKLPKPVLVKATISSKVTEVLKNEGIGDSYSFSKIKLVSINNSERIVSIQNAIDVYQKFIKKITFTSPSAGSYDKNLLIEVEKEIEVLSKELNEIQIKQKSYLFDVKTLTINDISLNDITILAFNDTYYLKKKKDFFTLIVADLPQKYNKVSDYALINKLNLILYTNRKFE